MSDLLRDCRWLIFDLAEGRPVDAPRAYEIVRRIDRALAASPETGEGALMGVAVIARELLFWHDHSAASFGRDVSDLWEALRRTLESPRASTGEGERAPALDPAALFKSAPECGRCARPTSWMSGTWWCSVCCEETERRAPSPPPEAMHGAGDGFGGEDFPASPSPATEVSK